MTRPRDPSIPRSALHLLAALASAGGPVAGAPDDAEWLVAADLATRDPQSHLRITVAGRAHLARAQAAGRGEAYAFRAQHMALTKTVADLPEGRTEVVRDEAESPLAWLARRKGKAGQALIATHQLQAGERLRADFTRAQMMPRTTANWEAPVARDRRAGDSFGFTETAIAARQRVRQALERCGPEFSGLLLDVCCFLKRLDQVERDRNWPTRSAKIVLGLALDRLARHYGISALARGAPHAALRIWLSPDASFTTEIGAG